MIKPLQYNVFLPLLLILWIWYPKEMEAWNIYHIYWLWCRCKSL